MTPGKIRGIWKNTTTANKIIAVSAMVSAAATVCYVIMTLLILWHMQSQTISATKAATAADSAAKTAKSTLDLMTRNSQDTSIQVDRLIAEQQKTAAAMEASLETSRESLASSVVAFQLEERPWVGVRSWLLSEEPSGVSSQNVRVTVCLMNTGRTPALEAIPMSGLSLWDHQPTSPRDFSTGKKPPISHGTIDPVTLGAMDFKFTTEPLPPLTAKQLLGYQTKVTNLYIEAMISYTDVFSKPHWVQVCAFHEFGTPLDLFTLCVNGNSMDRNR